MASIDLYTPNSSSSNPSTELFVRIVPWIQETRELTFPLLVICLCIFATLQLGA